MLSPLAHDDPHTLGAYRLLARIGAGGMGTVYLAKTAGGRTAAVKTLHPHLATQPAARSRFRLESDAARVTQGPHAATVYDADPVAPQPWLAMEYVIGPQLDAAVRLCGALPERAVRQVGAALADGLGQLHRCEAVHRDLKPANVIVTATGPKLIDFGIARALGDQPLTGLGHTLGTPTYQSPEQAAGWEHTAAGDVFALAGVLTFAASGRPPFGTGRPDELHYRIRHAAPDLGAVPPGLAPLLARCLAKDPADRPSTTELAAELAADDGAALLADALPPAVLREIARRADTLWQPPPPRLPPPPADLPPPPAPVVAAPGPTRRLLLAAGAGTVVGAALAGGAAWAWRGERDRTPAARPTRTRTATGQRPPDRLWTFTGRRPDTEGDIVPTRRGLVMPAGIVLAGVNPESGEGTWQSNVSEAWRWATDGTVVYALREADEGAALVLAEVDPTRGELGKPLLERADLDGREARNQLLCVAGNRAYLAARTAAGNRWYLLAVDLRSRREHWRRPLPAPPAPDVRPVLGATVSGEHLLLHRPAAYEGAADFAVHAVADGRQEWSRTEDYEGQPPTEPVHDTRHVYFSDTVIDAWRITEGDRRWRFGDLRDVGDNAGQTRRYGVPTVHEGVIYCTEGDRGLVAVGALTGSLNWIEEGLTGRHLNREAPPVVGAKYLYGLDDRGLRAVDRRTHRAVWTYETDATLLTADPARGRLYLREQHETFALPLL